VSGLPPDTTASELAARFGKFGVLMEDDEGTPKIKLYADENEQFNGEALVVYFIEDSVDLAIAMLDEAELRVGESGTMMRVKKAEFGHKGNDTEAKQPAKRVLDRKKATARINKMKRYAWSPHPLLV
jgi:HIV Tat-specific factor 1